MISARFPLARAREAFELAGDRRRAMKVLLDFSADDDAARAAGT
jgi:L-idonate 5-dehydrogenase